MTKTPIEERIRLLLEKAANTPYPHEAELAQKQAEKLMVKHGIEVLLSNEPGRAKMVKKSYFRKGVYGQSTLTSVYQIVAAYPGIMGYRNMHAPSNLFELVIVGKESAVDQAMALIMSLESQHDHALSVWKAEERTAAILKMMKRSQYKNMVKGFTLGFYNTVAGRIKALYEEESAGNELVLATKEEEIIQWLQEDQGVRLEASRKNRASYSDYSMAGGSSAGSRANIGQTAVGGQKASLGM